MGRASDKGRSTAKKTGPLARLLMEELRNSPTAGALDLDKHAPAIADLLSNPAIRHELAMAIVSIRDYRAMEGEEARAQLEFETKALPYRVRNLLAARDEARAIFALTKTGPMRALRQTLNDHPPSAEAVYWLMFETRHLAKSEAQRKAANARHAETNEMKARAISFYRKKKGSMTKDAAAEEFARLEPIKSRTVREWFIGL